MLLVGDTAREDAAEDAREGAREEARDTAAFARARDNRLPELDAGFTLRGAFGLEPIALAAFNCASAAAKASFCAAFTAAAASAA